MPKLKKKKKWRFIPFYCGSSLKPAALWEGRLGWGEMRGPCRCLQGALPCERKHVRKHTAHSHTTKETLRIMSPALLHSHRLLWLSMRYLTLFKAGWWELNTALRLNMKSSAIPWSIQSRRQESPTAAPWRVQPCLGKPACATKLMAIPVGFLSLYTLPSLSASQNSYSQLRVIPRKMQDLLQPVGNIGREELISRETVTNHNLQRAWKQSMYQAPLCGDKAAVFLVNVVPWFKVQEILQLGLPPLTGIHHY